MKRTNRSVQPPPEPVVQKDSVKLSFRSDVECTRGSADAMRYYMNLEKAKIKQLKVCQEEYKRMSNIIQIDKEKLSKLIKNRNKAEMSRHIGYASNYLSHVIGSSEKSGKMSKAAVNALDMIYGIKYEDYKPEEQKKEEITEYSDRMSKQELYEIIYKAVYEAVRGALSK